MLLSKKRSKATEKQASRKSKIFGVIFALLLCIAICLALYPTVSKIVNTANANSTVDGYSQSVDTIPSEEINEMFQEAEQYNAQLATMIRTEGMPEFDPKEHYYDILNINDEGIIGSIEIPSINVRLPIYHGTDEEFLDDGAGHLIGTSFPIGGESTHAVISAHTAFPGKKFFDDLTKVKEGDKFYVTVLNRKLEYKVTNIQVVLPSDSQSLSIVKGEDLVTLVTCTPYAINSHRLLVTGERVLASTSGSISDQESKTNNATIDSLPTSSNDLRYICTVVGFVILLIFFSAFVIHAVKRKKHADEEKESE